MYFTGVTQTTMTLHSVLLNRLVITESSDHSVMDSVTT